MIRPAEGVVLEGTPNEIIQRLAVDIAKALHEAAIPVDGVHVFALIHIAMSAVRASRAPDSSMGVMPSFATLLSAVTRGFSGDKCSPEEHQKFDEEFGRIVTSLGGTKIGVREGPTVKDGRLIMSPSLGVH